MDTFKICIFIFTILKFGESNNFLALQIRDYTTGIGMPNITCELFRQKNVEDIVDDGDASDLNPSDGKDNNWELVGSNLTSIRGCCDLNITLDEFGPGNYRLVYHTKKYFKGKGLDTFYPYEETLFTKTLADVAIPVFLIPMQGSPYGFTTYKGTAKTKNNC